MLFVPLGEDEAEAVAREVKKLKGRLADAQIVRRSLDARKKRQIGFHVEVALREANDPAPAPSLLPAQKVRRPFHVVIVGTGPAGTFAALRLVEAGAHVTLVDAGKEVQPRRHDLASLNQRGELNPDSNYCFGEGGAGTFSDGKLYTRSKDKSGVRFVLETLVSHGADQSILVNSRPHIGSNKLPMILVAMRDALTQAGATYVWSERVERLLIGSGRVTGIATASGREIVGDAVVLATGHSARGLYTALHAQGVALEPKGFAVGARIEQPQPWLDRAQYGEACGHPQLPAAFYEVTAQVAGGGGNSGNQRGVYSFCMCPGGWIVNAATEEGMLCTNGMSLKRRDSPFANAAIVVAVDPTDYMRPGDSPLAGIAFQQAIERRAFELGGGKFVAASQSAPDFARNKPSSHAEASSYRPGVVGGDVRTALPAFIGDAMATALAEFDRKMPGFAGQQARLIGAETRTSAPVRIVRGAHYVSTSHERLYPLAEGAGYAGGIVSAAIDGVRAADAMMEQIGR